MMGKENLRKKIAFGGIMLLAFIVRVIRFGTVPGGFNQDGAMGAVDALALATYGTDRFGMFLPAHLTAWGDSQMSAMLSYLTVPFIKIFGFNEVVVRLPLLMISMLGLWVLYLLMKDIFGEQAGLIVLLFAAINPWHIMQSRWALDCNLFPHFMLFSVYFLFKSMSKKLYVYIAAVFFALALYCYGIAFIAVPVFLAAACFLFLKHKYLNIKEILLSGFVFFMVGSPVIGVMVVNAFRLRTLYLPFVTIGFFEQSGRSTDILLFSAKPLRQLGLNAKALGDALLQKPDELWNSIADFGTMYLLSIPFALLGILMLIARLKNAEIKQKIGIWLVFFWFIAGVVSGLMINNVNINRINIIFYPLLIFIGLGIYYLLFEVIQKNQRRLAVFLIGSLYCFYFTLFTVSYFGVHNDQLSEAFYDGFGEAVKYVDSQDYDYIYVTSFSKREEDWQVSEILTQFHLRLDAHYTQGIAGRGADLPYRERYRYVKFWEESPDSGRKDVAYVVNNKELWLFGEGFEVMEFAYYSAVMPK